MSAITEQLRNAAKCAPLWKTIFEAAADEIERLQEEQNKVKAEAVRNTIDESEIFLINFLGEDIRFVKQSDLEFSANKLERGEV